MLKELSFRQALQLDHGYRICVIVSLTSNTAKQGIMLRLEASLSAERLFISTL
jgi:hypothetical protein